MRSLLLVFAFAAVAAAATCPSTPTLLPANTGSLCTAVADGSPYAMRAAGCSTAHTTVSDTVYPTTAACTAKTGALYTRSSVSGQCNGWGESRKCPATTDMAFDPLPAPAVQRLLYASATCDSDVGVVTTRLAAEACEITHSDESQLATSRKHVCSEDKSSVIVYAYPTLNCTGTPTANSTHVNGECTANIKLFCGDRINSAGGPIAPSLFVFLASFSLARLLF